MFGLAAAKKPNSTNKNDPIIFLSNFYADFENDPSPFQKELSRLLRDKTFLQGGGILGFGLKYKYTYSELDSYLHGGIAGLGSLLTPTEKSLYLMGKSLDLKPEFKVVYKMRDYPGNSIMSTTLSPFPNPAYPYPPTWENTSGFEGLCEQIGGDFIELSEEWNIEGGALKVEWVSPIEHINIIPEYIEKIGGEPTVLRICGSYVLTMTVPAWSERGSAKAGNTKKGRQHSKALEAANHAELGQKVIT